MSGAGTPFGHGAGTPFGHGAGTPFGHGAGTPFGHGAGTPFGHGAGRLLIVNADDYGLTEQVSAGILRAHREGIVTSTSVLAIGPAWPKVARWLEDHPALGIGVHLAAVGEDPPLLSAAEIPTLVDRRGHLRESYKGLILRMAAGRVDPADVEREFTAQLQAVLELGLPIGHLDAHQHLHLWPPVGRVVLELARRHSIPAVRVPHYRGVVPLALAVTALARRLAARAQRMGLRYPPDGTGIEVAGKLDHDRLRAMLQRLADHGAPAAELTVHPGEPDDPDRARYRWGYRWPDELAALTTPEAHEMVARLGFRLATYADIPAPTTASGPAAPPGPAGPAAS